MSATIPFALIFPTHLLDVLDDAWLGETLPDDGEKIERRGGAGSIRALFPLTLSSLSQPLEIPLPDGVAAPSEDPDDLPEGGPEPPPEPRWGELGLEELQ